MKRELDALITQMHSAGIPYGDAIRQFKKRYILEVLTHHKGNQCKAATELGMHRNTLSRTLGGAWTWIPRRSAMECAAR